MDDNTDKIKVISGLKTSEVFEYFNTTEKGLSNDEVSERQKKYGKNILPQAEAINPLKQLLKQFTHFMALLLWAAGILAIIAGMPQLAFATWAVIVINAAFAFFQEFRADRALAELAKMIPNRVKTYRNGELVIISAEETTVGDVIVLGAGDHVPADSRLIQADGLFLDNSLLTGESFPVDRSREEFDLQDKSAVESTNLIFAGTTVTEGKAVAVVYAAGSQTEIGKISKLTRTIQRGESTLEVQVQKIVKFITKVALVMGVAAFLMAVLGAGIEPRVGFIFAIGIIVANIPEGLLPTVSLTLAVGVQRMAKQNALVKKLSAVETLSATSVICTDKTGTITENKLTVKKIWTPDTAAEIGGAGYEKDGEIFIEHESGRRAVELLLTAAVVCSEATIKESKSDAAEWDIFGDPTEAAMLVSAAKYGISAEEERAAFNRLITIPFNSERKMMSVIVKNISDERFKKGSRLIFTKGASIEVINTCKYILQGGFLKKLTEDMRGEIIAVNDRMAGEGYRVLGVSYETAENGEVTYDKNLIFLGLTAMFDPPRPEVFEAVKQCREAGIKITIITGDYGITAAAIGKQTGLVEDKYQIITGSEVDSMSENALMYILEREEPLIFSRSTPEHKLRIVEAYKKLGHIVAVTGDGINDILALKSSHIGIAMGQGGTDVAREVADMILLDDNFATIIKAIEEGRSIYNNIRKFMTYILTSNVPEFIPFIAMALLKIPAALTVLQILAIDLGTDMVPALALGAEKPEPGILKKPPRKIEENLLDRNLFLRAYGFLGIIEGILSMAVFLYVWRQAGYSLQSLKAMTDAILYGKAAPEIMKLYQYATTMTLSSIVACQIGNIFICRSETLPFWKMFANKNNLIYVGLGFEVMLSSAIIFLPVLADVFQTEPLAFKDLIVLLLCPVVLIFLEESRKFVAKKYQKL